MSNIHWASQVSGSFNDGADWVGGVVPGAGDNAILDASGSTDYTVTAAGGGTVDSIQTAKTATFSITADDFTATDGAGSGANAGAILVGDGASFSAGGTFDNAGTIALMGGGDVTTLIVGAAGLSLTGAGQVTLTDSSNNFLVGAARSDVLTNVDDTISGAGHVGNGGLTLINEAKGVIDATGTSTVMTIDTYGETLANAGLIESTGAAGLAIQSTTIANTGVLKDTGTGALTLYGATVADSGAGQVTTVKNEQIDLKSGTITGAAMSLVSGATITTTQGTNSLAITTLTNQSQILVDEATSLELAGTFDNTGVIALSSTGGQTSLIVGAAGLSLTGAGQVTMTDSTANYIFGAARSDVLTNVDDTISGAGRFGNGGLTLINEAKGVIDATGTSALMTIDTYGETLANAGLIESTGAAGLAIQSTTIANTGVLKDTGTGALTLYGATVADSGAGQVTTVKNEQIDLENGTITGAAMTLVSGATITSDEDANALAITNMTNQSQILVDEATSLELAGTFDNTGVIALSSTGGQTSLIVGAAGLSLTGAGQVTLTDSTANYIFGAARSDVLTNVDDTISGAGHVGNGGLTLINEAKGVIDATGTSTVMTIDTYGETLANAGLIESTGAAGLAIQSTTIANTGVLKDTGTGALTLYGATVADSGAGQVTTVKNEQIDLKSGTITGAAMTLVSGATITSDEDANALAITNMTNQSQILVDEATSLELAGTFDNTGVIALSSTGGQTSLIVGAAGLSLTGAGQVTLTDSTANYIFGAARNDILTNVNNTISGAGHVGNGGLALINEAKGVIDATGTSALMTIDTYGETLANAGLIESTGAAGLTIQSTTIANTGTLEAAGSGVVSMYGATVANGAGGKIVVGKDAQLTFEDNGALTNLSGTTLTGGDYVVDADGVLQLADNLSIAQLDAIVALDGAGSEIQSLDTTTSSEVTLEDSLTGVSAAGALEILGGRNYSTANALANSGTIELGGGTLTSGVLTDAARSALTGFGVVASVFSDSGAVTSSGGALAFKAKGDSFAGVLGGDEIDFTGGTDLLAKGSSLTASVIGLSGAAVVTLSVDQAFSGAWNQGAATVDLAGFILTLSGASIFTGAAVDGAGTLSFSGGAQTIGAKTSLGAANWSITNGAVASLGENLTYAGVLAQAAGTTLALGTDTLTLTGSGSTLAGSVTGTGTLAFGDGSQSLTSGASLGVSHWSLLGAAAVTVDENLSYAGAFSEGSDASVTVSSGDTLSLTEAPSLAGAVGGAGTLAIGGEVTLGSGLALDVAALSVLSGATVTLGGARSYAGKLSQAAGSTLALAANTLTLTGSGSTLAGSVTGTGTLDLDGGSQSLTSGASLGVSHWTVSGDDAVTLDESLAYGGTFTEGSGSSLTVGSGDILTLSGASAISGSVDGAGALAFSGGTQALGSGAAMGVAHWSLASGASTTVNEDLSFGGVFSQAAGTSLSVASGDTLTLSKSPSLAGAVDGAGTLAIGGAVNLATGLSLGVANLSLLSGATVTLGGARSYAGALTEAAGSTLALGADTLTLTGSGSTISGSVTGTAALALAGGATDFDTGATLSVSKISESGGSTIADVDATTLDYAGTWTQSGGTLAVGAGDRVNFTGTGNSFEGVLSGAGTVAFVGGTDSFTGAHLTAATVVVNGATATLSGSLDLSGTMSVSSDDLVIAGGGASLGGGGALVLSNLATNKVSGGTLTNVNDLIKGAGALGDGAMAIVNDKGGIIDGDDTVALTIDTGSSTITNAGRIEAGPDGLTTVVSAVDNTGVLAAFGGTLTLDQAVTGTGKAEIDGGAADFAGTFTQNVAFIGAAGGTLELAHFQSYTGEITGFSKTGTTSLDLEDIAFVSGTTTASYSGTTTSGVLTVADGSHIAKITLEGNYLASKFTLSSDGHGGTTVTDPTAAAGAASRHRFVAAIAAFGSSGGVSHDAPDSGALSQLPTLFTPRMTHGA